MLLFLVNLSGIPLFTQEKITGKDRDFDLNHRKTIPKEDLMKPGLRNVLFTLTAVITAPLVSCSQPLMPSPEMAWQDHDKIKAIQATQIDEVRIMQSLQQRLAQDIAFLSKRALDDEQVIIQIYDTVQHIREELKMAPIRSERLKNLDERLQRLEASVEIMWPKVERKRK